MNIRILKFLAVAACIASAGCSEYPNNSPLPSVSDSARAELKQPVNCGTARGDVAILEEERASVGKRALSGVRMVLPIAAVAGLLMGDYSDRVQVATGQYNDDIDAKINQIKRTCKL